MSNNLTITNLDRVVRFFSNKWWSFRSHSSFDAIYIENGREIAVPVRMGLGYNLLSEPSTRAEAWMPTIIALVLKSGADGYFVDVGANDGGTLRHYLSTGAEIKYLGFEPIPKEYFQLTEIIRLNNLKNSYVFPLALSDSEGPVTLFIGKTSETSSIASGFRDDSFYASETVVWTTTGDRIINDMNLGPVGLIKVDVEGSELRVLQGLNSTIGKSRPFIIFEMLPHKKGHTERETLSKDITEFFSKRNYLLHKINNDASLRRVEVAGESITSSLTNDEVDWSDANYLAVPRERPFSGETP